MSTALLSALDAVRLPDAVPVETVRVERIGGYLRDENGAPVHGSRRDRRAISRTVRTTYGARVDTRYVEDKYCAPCATWQRCETGAEFGSCTTCGGRWQR